MQTYLFYDIETTGLSKSFDQVLQFAAIRTDLQLNEIERHELNIKLNPDVIPSPKALITHHIGIHAVSEGLSEYDAIRQIHQWLNQPGTISLGYNTLGFDDEFLRFSFYRHLLPPYSHQFANQCSRMDLYPMTVMYYLFKQSVIEWPIINDKISLKLEHINQCNQLASGQAHNAMVDVEVTLALAKRFFQETDMWNYLSGYFNKKIDAERIQSLDMALIIDGALGQAQHYQAIAFNMGNHYHYKNQLLWLRLDQEKLKSTQKESIPETTQIIRKKLGEPHFILPLKERFKQHISEDRLCLAKDNLAWLQKNSDLFTHIREYHADYKYPDYPATDIDARLYLNGFWSTEEEALCREFHKRHAKEKAHLLNQMQQHPRLYILALRLLGRHFPEVLSTGQAQQFSDYMKQVNPSVPDLALIDFQGKKRLTPQCALNEIHELLPTELNDTQRALLNELAHYLKERFNLNF